MAITEIMENRAEWQTYYKDVFLKHFEENGKFDWKLYQRPKNITPVSGKGIDLSQSRLILISTAGAYLKDEQEAFDAENDFGDYSLRLFPSATGFDKLEYAHTHYDQTAVRQDAQVLLPLRQLEDMVKEGKIGSLTTNMISYMGYQPDAIRTLDQLVPAVVAAAKAEQADAALLVPA
jgi:D-proline reductase (dithiol) PrdB